MKTTKLFFSALLIAITTFFLLPYTTLSSAHKLMQSASWSVVASPNVSHATNVLYGVSASSPSDIWAIGSYQVKTNKTLIEHWNGKAWTIVNSPDVGSSDNNLYGVAALSPQDVIAVGEVGNGTPSSLTLRWHANRWQVLPTPHLPMSNSLHAISGVPHSGEAWAVGYYYADQQNMYGLIEHWTGTQWSVVKGPAFNEAYKLVSVSASASNDVWALGYTLAKNAPLIEHWDGKRWNITQLQQPYFYPTAIAETSSHTPWITGSLTDQNSGGSQTFTEYRPAQQWVRARSQNPATNSQLIAIAARSDHDVWAVGSSGAVNSRVQDPLIEHWNGKAWSVVAAARPLQNYSSLEAITFLPGTDTLWTVGFRCQDGAPPFSTLIERYQ